MPLPRSRALSAGLAILTLACGRSASAIAPSIASAEASVLFVGNSLTSANDLAARVAEVAAASGHTLRTSSVALSGASLADHWDDGRAVRTIRESHWDVVALQQGPSTLPESRTELIASARQFATEIRRAGGRPALLMIWPLPGQEAAAVSASYRAAAEAVDGLLIPAGDAWTLAQQRDSTLVFTVSDGYHPSPLGTWLAALTVQCTLFPQAPPVLPRSASGLSLDGARRDLLSDSACRAASGAAAGG